MRGKPIQPSGVQVPHVYRVARKMPIFGIHDEPDGHVLGSQRVIEPVGLGDRNPGVTAVVKDQHGQVDVRCVGERGFRDILLRHALLPRKATQIVADLEIDVGKGQVVPPVGDGGARNGGFELLSMPG